LKGLKEIKCRFYNGILFVTENIPNKIYKNLTTYGKIKSKFVYVFLKVWQILAIISVIIMLIGIALTVALTDKLFLIIGASICFGTNLLCGNICYLVFCRESVNYNLPFQLLKYSPLNFDYEGRGLFVYA